MDSRINTATQWGVRSCWRVDMQSRHGSSRRCWDFWDNAMIESFFGTMKQEWANHHRWHGLLDARAGIHDYIEVFYHRQRLHSALGYRTPMEVDRGLA